VVSPDGSIFTSAGLELVTRPLPSESDPTGFCVYALLLAFAVFGATAPEATLATSS
jgi:hypothetical protein